MGARKSWGWTSYVVMLQIAVGSDYVQEIICSRSRTQVPSFAKIILWQTACRYSSLWTPFVHAAVLFRTDARYFHKQEGFVRRKDAARRTAFVLVFLWLQIFESWVTEWRIRNGTNSAMCLNPQWSDRSGCPSTTFYVLHMFVSEYLGSPTEVHLRWILYINTQTGFPGFGGSWCCQHWTWKNFAVARVGHFGGKDAKPPVAAEAIANAYLYIFGCHSGKPGIMTDVNILKTSPLMSAFCAGSCSSALDTSWFYKGDRSFIS